MIFCGVDGGGTKTKIIIAEDEKILMSVTCGPSSIDTVTNGVTKSNIESGLKEIYDKLDIPQIDSIFLGLGGIASKEHKQAINELFRKSSYLRENAVINSDNDIKNAYLSSCSGRNNITIIVGTGAVAYGVDELGNTHRTNGIHYLEGDFGGAYDVGVRALKKMSLAFDGRIKHTDFTTKLLNKFNITNMPEIIAFFDKYKNDRTYIAQIAKLVTEYATLKDNYAEEILDEATDEMLLSIIGVDKKISLNNREIGIVGSLGNSREYFNRLQTKVAKYDSTIKLHSAELDPVEGSLIEARNQITK